ncbi:hypothetical protein [Nocardioides sp. cx-173]|uniref:hypothetical protein n=1 Tax=Nocardioides sp. cx-173 TaxID=2898796 RepID=UPI001E5AD3B8|nr:hypothetical protein [Nocardioides sp. cx-173]MCD4525222.1 hypothetical protein [Nocardioides sp. cx-173]UGB40975.1 hypothetical protein LQ940_16555 [Nocardioides sp. cx-173]
MAGFILGLWIVTAVGGSYLWSFTTGVGRPESTARSSSLPPSVLFLHPLVGLTGFSTWVGYLYVGGDVLPWVAFGLLVTGALLGDVLVMRTLRPRAPALLGAVPADQDPEHSLDENAVANARRAEDLIPRPVIVMHGVLAALLMLLVFLVAVGVGTSG